MSVREEQAYLLKREPEPFVFPYSKEVSLGDFSQIYFYAETVRSKNHSMHI